MIRILFLDTSALLSFFISDKGTPAMRWLISSANKAHDDTRYIINNQVIKEFEASLKILAEKDDIKQSTADSILALFNNHYKNRKFKLTGCEASVEDTMDGIYSFIGRLSQPILVTSNAERAAGCAEYKLINPHRHDPSEIELLLQGKEKLPAGTGNKKFFQHWLKRTRMTFAL